MAQEVTRRAIYWPYLTRARTTLVAMEELSKVLAPLAFRALRDVVSDPKRGGASLVAAPVRCFSAGGARVWLYFGIETLQKTDDVFHLLLVYRAKPPFDTDPTMLPRPVTQEAIARWATRPRS